MKNMKYILPIAILFVFSCSNDAESEEENVDNQNPVEATTNIPDVAFENALIEQNFDDVQDGKVLNSKISGIRNLILDDKGISNLSGIESFSTLENLSVRENSLTTLNLSGNSLLKFIWAEDNELTSLNVSNLIILEKIGADRNGLTQINVTTNGALQLLNLSENDLISIDVSNNNELTDFTVVNNPLSCILVNQSQLDSPPTDWSKDDSDSYALDCE